MDNLQVRKRLSESIKWFYLKIINIKNQSNVLWKYYIIIYSLFRHVNYVRYQLMIPAIFTTDSLYFLIYKRDIILSLLEYYKVFQINLHYFTKK